MGDFLDVLKIELEAYFFKDSNFYKNQLF